MEYLRAIFLGIVQGIAEFLPISSSGHLVIFQELFDVFTGASEQSGAAGLEMNIALHLGTLFSIVVVYRDDIRRTMRNPREILLIATATVPVVVVGLLFKSWFEEAFETPLVVGFALLLTAALLALGQRLDRDELTIATMPLRTSLLIGCFQAIALVPGISRSGSTIAGGLLCGLQRQSATTFSFLIAVPAIGGASMLLVKDFLEAGPGAAANPVGVLLVGAGAAFVTGLVSLRWLIRLISQRKLHWFAYYCFAVGLTTIVWSLSAGI